MSLNIPIQDFYSRYVKNLKPVGNGHLKGLCPFHDDRTPSFTVNSETNSWYCHACVIGGGPRQFAEQLGVEPPEDGKGDDIEATYDYKDEEGRLLFQVVRFRGKQFRQRRPDGSRGWAWDLKGVRRVLYRLPDLKGKKTVYVVEGERDVDRLWALGIPATTCPMGAGKWQDEYTGQIKDLGVEQLLVLPDNDPEGLRHAGQVAQSCLKSGLKVKIVELPDLPPKGDVSDWLDKDNRRDDLAEIVSATPLMTLEGLTGEAEGVEKPLIKFTRACDLKVPAMEWIIDGLIPRGMITLLSGKDTIGKTLFALEIIQSVLTGEPLLDHWLVRQTGPVLVLPLDDAISTTMERLEHKEVRDRGDLWVAPDYDVNLDNPYAMLETLKNEAKRLRPVLVLLDALYCLVPGFKGAGIDQAVMGRVMRTIRLIASESGAGVLLVAHDNKSLKGIAGSHTITAGGKSIIRLVLPEGDPDKPERVLTLEGNFGRSAKHQLLLESTGEKLPGGTLEKMKWTYVGTQKEEQGEEIREAILSLLVEDGFDGTAKKVAKALKRGIEPVRRVLKELAEQEEIEEYDKPTGGRPSKKYRALPLVPDEPLVSDVSELKS